VSIEKRRRLSLFSRFRRALPRSRALGVGCLAATLLVCSADVYGSDEDPAPQTGASSEEAPPQEPPRPMTRMELEREIELVQRDLENLLLRVGDADPTPEQRQKTQGYLARLTELRKQLEERKAVEDETKQGDSVKARWTRVRAALNDFTSYDVDDGMFRIRLGGRFQLDGTLAWADDDLESVVGPVEDSLEWRRGRIFAVGRFFRRFDFRFEYDFAADNGFKDVFLEGAKFTKYFRWRIGQFKEPLSIGRQNSGFDLAFLELAAPVQTFAPGRSWGLMLRHSEMKQRMFWAVAATTGGKTTDDSQNAANFTFTGRVSGLPVYREDGKRLVHVGISASLRSPRSSDTQYRARPEARFAPFFVDTGVIPTSDVTLLGAEFATVQGPFWLQAEWIGSWVNADELGDLSFNGAYAEVGWFLTGESRAYIAEAGHFTRVMPNRLFRGGNPFTGKGDGGAIEITGRYSTVDLNDGSISGGEMTDISAGLGWYLTAASRLRLDYVHSTVRGVGSANLVLLRYQFNP
jgi:phosphate-selective porin OprO/OprP